jgi:hypothetical protein
MSKIFNGGLAMVALFSGIAVSGSASSAFAGSRSADPAAMGAQAAKMQAAQLRQQRMMAAMAAKQSKPGLKVPYVPVELPSEVGGCKLDLKGWQSTLNKMLKEEC